MTVSGEQASIEELVLTVIKLNYCDKNEENEEVRARAHTHTHTHARTHALTHARTHARAHARTHARTYTNTHTHIQHRAPSDRSPSETLFKIPKRNLKS